ncbi:hypothetical protein [Pseudodesulfovibrio senegalensis]|uniref:Autotransporter outer membrane beta-barrel domain-containing protein n=1 Tax=Pseudodesulfovibrio senegalensis TaxID=1721087 RepID=A0A6N6N1D7_9BACT|nr:hypothetical protein [Pseudodesulfovibrio senegalensis]KAB1441636.1 hypothetical protein F8A88_08525 [Pseudodesulfovibrio senegalensis]
MPPYLLCLVALLVCIATSAPPARCESSFWLTPQASYYQVQLPEYAPMAMRAAAGINKLVERLTCEDGDTAGPLAEMTVGWQSQGALFFEAQGFYTSMTSEQNDLFDSDPPIRVGWFPIDGTQGPVGLGSSHDVTTHASRDVKNYGGRLIVGWDVPLNDQISIRPFVGYSGMELNQDFSFQGHEIQPSYQTMSLDEEVDATYHGLIGGSKIVFDTGDIVAHLSGSVSVYNVHAEYKGYQVSSNPYTVHASDTEDEFCAGVTLEGGVSRRISNWTLGLSAGANYLSYVPRIIASDKSTSAGTRDGKPSHIGDGESYGWKIGMNVSCAF